MPGPGRPTYCTPEIQEEMCRHAKAGLNQTAIAWMCKVAPRTLRAWLTETDRRYNEPFALAFRSAQAEGMEGLRKLATSDPAGARWMLERLYPKIFRPDLFPEGDEASAEDTSEAIHELVEQRVAERMRESQAATH